jgi:cystathionine beta-synthase
MRVRDSIAELIGDTPLVRLKRMFPPPGPAVYLKMEQFNPGGSIKDRTALGMIRAEERSGRLRPSTTIVESSSGNTAIGLAILAKDRGYDVVAICDRHLPEVKRARLRTFGADIVFLPETPVGLDTVELRIAVANELARTMDAAVTLGQYSHPGNPEIHYSTTGPEIWEHLDGDVAAVVAAVGTCGTIAGVGRYAKERDPRTQVVGAEPEGSVIFGGPPGRYLIQGGGLSFVPSIFDESVVDRGEKISDADALAALQEVAATEGWMLGGTSGLVLAAIERVAQDLGPADAIVGIVPDGGDRYVETLFNPDWIRASGAGTTSDRARDEATVAAAAELGCTINVTTGPGAGSLASLQRRLELPTAA